MWAPFGSIQDTVVKQKFFEYYVDKRLSGDNQPGLSREEETIGSKLGALAPAPDLSFDFASFSPRLPVSGYFYA